MKWKAEKRVDWIMEELKERGIIEQLKVDLSPTPTIPKIRKFILITYSLFQKFSFVGPESKRSITIATFEDPKDNKKKVCKLEESRGQGLIFKVEKVPYEVED